MAAWITILHLEKVQMGYESFEGLDVWKKARQLKKDIRELAKTFPPEEKFRLTDQIIRSSRSVCSQLAEGHGPRTFPDRLRFALFGRGSLSETLNHLIDAFDNEYITDLVLQEFRMKVDGVEQVLNGYIRYLESEIDKGKGKR